MSARARTARLAATRARAIEPRATFLIYARQAIRGLTRSALFWGIGLALYAVMLVAIFPSFKGSLDVSTYPQGMRDALGITDMSHIRSFLQAEFFSFLPLVLAFYPMTVLAGTVAGAEERRWLDVLLGNPLSRRTVVLGAFAALAIVLLAILVADAVIMWACARLLDIDLSLSASLQGMLANWPICLAFGALALALSAAVRSRAAALGITVAAMFGFYLLNLLATLVAGVAWLKWLSAFHYYGEPMNKGLFWGGAAVLLVAAAVLVAVAVAAFERRDIYT